LKVIEFSDVVKTYSRGSQKIEALKGLSFQVQAGQMLAFLGPNGAGKSTSLEILLGLQQPSSGQVKVFDQTPGDFRVRRKMTVTPQDLQFPSFLKVREIIQWNLTLYNKPWPAKLIEKLDLGTALERTAGALSGGQRRRLGLCLAFAVDPEVVLLDEPTTGLDVQGKAALWDFLSDYVEKGGTLILTTHDLFELSKMPTHRMLMINKGRLVKDGLVRDLLQQCKFKRVSFLSSSPDLKSTWAEKIEYVQGLYTFWTQNSEELLRDLFRQTSDVRDLSVDVGRLEDVFQLLDGVVDHV
jgi:ABC-2 type transport system ATP-binding protein